jgi:hypothetical protein
MSEVGCDSVQERVLGEDGQPRKMKEGEDVYHMGLVLEWVFGTIVSTAEKARDGAKRYLGGPSVENPLTRGWCFNRYL